MLINNAYAQAAAPAAGGMEMNFFIIILMFGVLYFMMIRPQAKRAKEHRTMIEALQKNDEVITSGGLLGKISKVGDIYVTLELAENVEVQVQKTAIQTLLPKGTVKSSS